ncbi:MAG: 6-carboxytetrahydropterin synthase [Aeromonas sp.]
MKLFVRDLTVIDASVLCAEQGLVGCSWLVDIELAGELNAMSMLLDFAQVKKRVKALIDGAVDHRLLVPAAHSAVQVDKQDAARSTVDLCTEASIHLACPAQAFALLPCAVVDKAAVTAYLHAFIARELPDNIADLSLTLRDEVIHGASYCYSHGLKKHDGNCQRIAHGHRSAVEIYRQGVRDSALEAEIAANWHTAYLVAEEDIAPLSALNLSPLAQNYLTPAHIGVRYQAPQGQFALALPRTLARLLPTDTTAELLADYLATQISARYPGQAIRVLAYEGVGKGAIAERD